MTWKSVHQDFGIWRTRLYQDLDKHTLTAQELWGLARDLEEVFNRIEREAQSQGHEAEAKRKKGSAK